MKWTRRLEDTMMTTRDERVTWHNGRPAVNVKIRRAPSATDLEAFRDANDASHYFTLDWIDEHMEERTQGAFWDDVIARQWDYLESQVNDDDIFSRKAFGRVTKIYSEGRSGGWAIVDHIKDTEDWTDEHYAQWARFEALCAEACADVFYQYFDTIYYNVFEPWAERQGDAATVGA